MTSGLGVWRAWVATAVLFAGPWACTSTGGAEDAGPLFHGPPEVHLGGAGPGEPHTELADGSAVQWVAGLQGGYHLWASLQVANMDTGQITVRYRLVRDGTEVGGGLRRGVRFTRVNGVEETTGLALLLGTTLDPHAWPPDSEVHVEMTVEDAGGRTFMLDRMWLTRCCQGEGG